MRAGALPSELRRAAGCARLGYDMSIDIPIATQANPTHGLRRSPARKAANTEDTQLGVVDAQGCVCVCVCVRWGCALLSRPTYSSGLPKQPPEPVNDTKTGTEMGQRVL